MARQYKNQAVRFKTRKMPAKVKRHRKKRNAAEPDRLQLLLTQRAQTS